jgi:DNA-binding response OmpR family regulator
MSERILVVEDEAKTAAAVRLYLEDAGYAVDVASDGVDGLAAARGGNFDLLVLDVMLPRLDGTDLCSMLRVDSDLPIIMLTARTTEEQRIRGLDLGADDYIAKPFSPRELVARVRAVLRRSKAAAVAAAPQPLVRGELLIDVEGRRVCKDGHEVPLTATEFDLLHALARRPGKVCSREELVDRALGPDFVGMDRTVDAHIKNLRKKIEVDRRRPRYVQTVFGAGYRFASDAPPPGRD